MCSISVVRKSNCSIFQIVGKLEIELKIQKKKDEDLSQREIHTVAARTAPWDLSLIFNFNLNFNFNLFE